MAAGLTTSISSIGMGWPNAEPDFDFGDAPTIFASALGSGIRRSACALIFSARNPKGAKRWR
jgi:hypothetical protein